ncbi:putative queuine tRNA-ribosyltransferase [Cryptosporidium felis]|nr:putative queuine tRNA-ribosyltransferase [Cryptosporidium felis]
MASFHILKCEDDGIMYRLGVIEIPRHFLAKYDDCINGQLPEPNCECNDKVKIRSGLDPGPGEPDIVDFAKVFTPAISIPTIGGLPYYVLPRIETDFCANSEISSILPEMDYLLVGHGPDIERIKRREGVDFKERGCRIPTIHRKSINANKFDVLAQPKPQLANKDYVMYMMFRQPLFEGVSNWNGPDGLFMQTNSGRIQVRFDDFIASIRHFCPAFFTSPAEESLTGASGKNASFRSIKQADEMILRMLAVGSKCLEGCESQVKRDLNVKNANNGVIGMDVTNFDAASSHAKFNYNGQCDCNGNVTKKIRILANIQGAHYENYRAAASLGIWDLCKGEGIGLGNVGFTSNGDAELKIKSSEASPITKEFDDLILGATIGGIGYSEDSSIRAKCIREVVCHLPDDKVRFISLCVGSPVELLQAIYLGIDVIESPYVYKCSLGGIALTYDFDEFFKNNGNIEYTCEEKEIVERFLLQTDFSNTESIENKTNGSFGGAKYINLGDMKYSWDSEKITSNSPVSYSKAYIHHLINSKEMLGLSLLFLHNYWQYQGLLASIRKAIFAGGFKEFMTWFMYTQTDLQLHPIKLPEPVLETYTFDGMKGHL